MDRDSKEFSECKDSTNFHFSDSREISDENERVSLNFSSENQHTGDNYDEIKDTEDTMLDCIHNPDSGSEHNDRDEGVGFSETEEDDGVTQDPIAYPAISIDESNSPSVPTSAVIPHLQSLLESVAQQRVTLELIQITTDDLEKKVTSLMNELSLVKAENAELKLQLNAANVRKEEPDDM